MTALRWHEALAFALVGERLDFGVQKAPEPASLVAELGGRGWPVDRVHGLAAQRAAGEQPWPFPVPDALRGGLGAAQFQAALAACRDLLGLTGEARAPSTRTDLSPAERRLLADVPPHHGH